jgi:oxygen-dependent protoporphyrinogen oxidase
MSNRTLIIGGGISGLTTAWSLSQKDISCELWESSEALGGKIKTDNTEGYITEQSASMIMNYEPEIDKLLNQCGVDIQKELRNNKLKRYIVNNSSLKSMPMSIVGIMTSNLFSIKAKLRLMLEPFISNKHSYDESVSSFIRRRLGNEVLDKVIDPFISGTLASNVGMANAASVLPRLSNLEKKHGSITAGILYNKFFNTTAKTKPQVFSFSGGMSVLIKALSSNDKVSFKTNYKVISIERIDNSWKVTVNTPDGKKCSYYNNLVICTPAYIASDLLKTVDKQIAALLAEIKYTSMSVVHLGFDNSSIDKVLDGGGYLTPHKEYMNIIGSLWISSMFSNRAPKGKTLLSSYIGGVNNLNAIDWNDDKCVSTVLRELDKLVGIKGAPEFIRIDRHNKALPLYHGQYKRQMQRINKLTNKLPNLYINSSFDNGVSIRDRILSANIISEKYGK